ncbi:MAG: hypothetical protein GY950_12545, partial [bacterium]|nr:hypothetical protein [bacterium]
FNKGNTTVGGIFTATNRHLGDQSQLNFLHRSAYSGGLDFIHSWKEKEWFVYGTLIFSRVKGDKEAILNTQKSPVRYFQRPDADHLTLDPERTSLSGHGGSFFVGKVGGGRFQGVLGVTWRSPGLEFNDIGYLRSADRIFESLWLNYRINKPFSIFRRVSLSFDQGKIWDSAGTGISGSIEFRSDLYFKNYWTFESSIGRQGDFLDTTAMRGGPALKLPGQWEYEFSAHSDKRKRFHFGAGLRLSRGDNSTSRGERYSGDITFRPSNALSISLEPGISYSKHDLQYVSTVKNGAVSAENRYIFAAIDQKTVDITVRIDYSITPDLSIQFYGQPFISSGKYTNFKSITQPRAAAFNDRFHLYGADEISYCPGSQYYYVSETGDGPDYGFFDPNFKILEFRSNLVLRWEYTPGSTLYLVWSQGRSAYITDYDRFDFRGGMRDLFHTPPHDVFLLKFTYRFKI